MSLLILAQPVVMLPIGPELWDTSNLDGLFFVNRLVIGHNHVSTRRAHDFFFSSRAGIVCQALNIKVLAAEGKSQF